MAECERRDARGLETQSCPRTGLFMTSDVTEVRPLSPGSGEGPRHTGRDIVVDVKRLRQLEQENGRLKKMVADRDLEIDVLKEITRKKW